MFIQLKNSFWAETGVLLWVTRDSIKATCKKVELLIDGKDGSISITGTVKQIYGRED